MDEPEPPAGEAYVCEDCADGIDLPTPEEQEMELCEWCKLESNDNGSHIVENRSGRHHVCQKCFDRAARK